MQTALEAPTATPAARSEPRFDFGGSSKRDARAKQNSVFREVLTFCLGNEEYGIDILKVQEIRSYEQPTRIANAPSYLKGVVDLRGVIVPIVDLRVKFGCVDPSTGEAAINPFTVVIVLNVRGRVLGAVVDSVSDVTQLSTEQIREAPQMTAAVDTSYITGIAQLGERLLIVMDIESLMSSAELGLIDDSVGHQG
ncbi:MAG: chemotaxis protein CheW [Aquabacterium sp.]|jgi:purine-binding chemotaxis protein CheW|nr:MAG: chemotaxis protein CheW [Aquabacterium sp.]